MHLLARSDLRHGGRDEREKCQQGEADVAQHGWAIAFPGARRQPTSRWCEILRYSVAMKVSLEDDKDDAVLAGLMAGMRAFNTAAVPGLKAHKITAAVRDDDGTLRGGVIGRLSGDSVYMEIVWNDETVRGTGRGTQLMRLVEDEARRLGAKEAWLYTMSFQAKPFYEKLGYREFACLPWLDGRHARHFMRKDL